MAYSRPKVEMGKEARRITRGAEKKSQSASVDNNAREETTGDNQNSCDKLPASEHVTMLKTNTTDEPQESLPQADRNHFNSALAAELNEVLESNKTGGQTNQQHSIGKESILPQHHKDVSRVSSIDWIRERARDATEDISYNDVFKDELPSMDTVPFSPGKGCCVSDDIFDYLDYLREHQTCLLPAEPNKDFLDTKKQGDKTLIPSEEWFREYESQKSRVSHAIQNDAEVSAGTYADTSSCATDETSIQSSIPQIANATKKQSMNRNYCTPTDDDVLLGRGGLTNHHPGNKRYRKEADKLKPLYVRSTKREKYQVSESLVKKVKSSGGRFLIQDESGRWCEATKDKARKKASQALREHRRRKISSDEESI